VTKRAGRGLWQNRESIGRVAGGMGRNIADFTVRHPYLATGIGLGMYGMMAGGEEREMTGEEIGKWGTSTGTRRSLHESTFGLVQGLHGGRH
jgi:hypothetical protein